MVVEGGSSMCTYPCHVISGEDFVHEGILGTTFTGRLIEETEVAGIPAVVPTISGRAWVTQHCQIVVDPTDPFPQGYTVGDIWAA